MIDLPTLVALHAQLLLWARDAEAIAANNGPHTERERAEADTRRREAAALAALLAPHGVTIPDPRQLALFSDGGRHERA